VRSPVIGKDPAINPGGYKAGGPIPPGLSLARRSLEILRKRIRNQE